jgi:hypothetical protein
VNKKLTHGEAQNGAWDSSFHQEKAYQICTATQFGESLQTEPNFFSIYVNMRLHGPKQHFKRNFVTNITVEMMGAKYIQNKN